MKRCVWCNKGDGQLKEIVLLTRNRIGLQPREKPFLVHPEHEQAFVGFHGRAQRYGRWFLGLAAAAVLAGIAMEGLALLGDPRLGAAGAGVTVLILGLAAIALPFATPETVAMFGARRAIALVRSSGVVLLAAGVWLLSVGLR